jgi:hypothetical protein
MPTYKALSVRQPDAWFLVQGLKTCENRTWNTTHRGTLLIHAGSKAMTKDDWADLRDICEQLELPVPNSDDLHLQTGGLIGAVYLAEVTAEPDPDWEAGWWDEQSLAWLVDGAFPFDEFVPFKGKLGLFSVDLPFDITWDEPTE